jgi:pyruvate,water dikinase
MAKKITPLYLIDPKEGNFHAKCCETYHDITRFAHEMAMKEMFSLMDQVEMASAQIVHLKTKVPLNLYVLDLGGGLKEDRGKKQYEEGSLRSAPLSALLQGMGHPEISWVRPVPKGLTQGLSGFFSVMYESTLVKHEDFWDKTYAIISKEYLNLSCKLGYHYSNVEAYCVSDIDSNYISFTFMGGGADITRRRRRTRFIGTVLVKLGFKVEVKADLIKAQFPKYDEATTIEKLNYLGRLMGCSQQLDMSLSNDFMVDKCIEAFLSGDYRFFSGD